MRWLLVPLLAMALGCGDDGGVPADGAPSGDAAAVGITPPAAPLAPDFGTCPEGWGQATAAGEAVPCEPWPEGREAACPVGEAHFVGTSACAPVGGSCPSGDFSEALPTDRALIYVLAGATGGDGTLSRPYGSLAEFAFGALASGTVIALGRGTYAGEPRLARGVSLWGACAAETALASTVPGARDGVVTVLDPGSEVRDLRIEESPRLGLALRGGAGVQLEGVLITGALGMALLVEDGAVLTARRLVVRDTRPRVVERDFGRGLAMVPGAAADVSEAVFEGNHEYGVYAPGADTTLLLRDVAVVGTRARTSDGTNGNGLLVTLGAAATVERSAFVENTDVGVLALEPATHAVLTDVVIRDTGSREADGLYGSGIGALRGAAVDATRALIERNRGSAVLAAEGAARVGLTDAVVRDTNGQVLGLLGGDGLRLQFDSSAEVARVRFERSRAAGVVAAGGGAMLALSDVVVSDTRADEATGGYGRGLNAQMGASLSLSRGVVEQSLELGLYAGSEGTTVVLEDVVVCDTASQETDGRWGRGLNVGSGASLSGRRLLLERNHELSVFADGAGTTVSLSEVVIRDTGVNACASTSCPGNGGGMGLGAFEGAAITADHFEVARAAVCGVYLATGGAMDLSEGLVSECVVGACVQVSGYDFERLTGGGTVLYADNETNLDSTTLPVPEPSAPIPE